MLVGMVGVVGAAAAERRMADCCGGSQGLGRADAPGRHRQAPTAMAPRRCDSGQEGKARGQGAGHVCGTRDRRLRRGQSGVWRSKGAPATTWARHPQELSDGRLLSPLVSEEAAASRVQPLGPTRTLPVLPPPRPSAVWPARSHLSWTSTLPTA